MSWFECTRHIYKDIVVVFIALCWGSPSQQENFLHHHHVAAPTLCCRMNVSALALLNPKTSRFIAVTSYRCRVRFRRPTIKNYFILLLISEILDCLTGFKIFTKLDLMYAYYRLYIRQGDEWKMAFYTHYSHFKYLVLPFRLTNRLIIF